MKKKFFFSCHAQKPFEREPPFRRFCSTQLLFQCEDELSTLHVSQKMHCNLNFRNMATLHLCRQSAMRSPLRLFPPPLRILIGRSYSTTAIQLDFMAVRRKRKRQAGILRLRRRYPKLAEEKKKRHICIWG